MPQVFLSYDRADAAKARTLAEALENAGHSVWWDRHIKGGAQYSKEIEEALKRADAVVVLWSRQSVESAWVRDEAAAGRDTGRLVPVRLDRTDPPMGFRQYQTIDFSGRGRSRDKALQDLLGAVASPSSPVIAATSRQARLPLSRMAWGALGVVVVALLAFLAWPSWSPKAPAPSVTVVAGDTSTASRALARDLLVKLGSLQSARTDSLQLMEPASSTPPDFAFKVGAADGSGDPGANLALVDRAGTLLWSRQFAQPGGNAADLRQQLAYSAGQVLECATEALEPEHPRLDRPTLRLYLGGCADLSALNSDPRTAISIFRDVTQQAPRFAGAWGKLLIAELEAFKSSGASDRRLQDDLRQHVMEARKIDPDLAETYLVQSWLQPPRPILGWMRYADQALAKNPDSWEVLENHAIGLGHFGRMRDAIANARRATDVDPLSPGARQTLIMFLADSGAYAAAQRELDEAERLWPGASNMRLTRFLVEYRYGDARKALRMLEEVDLGMISTPAQTSFLAARIDPSPANIERAVAQARQAYEVEGSFQQYVQILATLGRKDEVIAVLHAADPALAPGVISVFFRLPFAQVRRDPRFMTIAHRYGIVDYWLASGRWADYCSEPDLPYDCKAEAARLSRSPS